MRSFWKWLFRGPEDDRRMRVSLLMRRDLFARVDRIARRHDWPGDLLVDAALERWLETHEEALLRRPMEAQR